MQKGRTVAIIPARGGSKGIPKKNIRLLGGLPLLAWPINIAKEIPEIDRIIVSTDDKSIAKVALKYGAEVMLRPARLANDKTPTLPVLQQVVSKLIDDEYPVNKVVLLYATSPFLNAKRIIEGLGYLDIKGINSAVGVREIKGKIWSFNPRNKKFSPEHPKKPLNRQYFTPWLHEAGNIYITKADVLLKQRQLIDADHCKFLKVEEDECLDIDHMHDLVEARNRIKEGKRR